MVSAVSENACLVCLCICGRCAGAFTLTLMFALNWKLVQFYCTHLFYDKTRIRLVVCPVCTFMILFSTSCHSWFAQAFTATVSIPSIAFASKYFGSYIYSLSKVYLCCDMIVVCLFMTLSALLYLVIPLYASLAFYGCLALYGSVWLFCDV